jgi:hypothetical protein
MRTYTRVCAGALLASALSLLLPPSPTNAESVKDLPPDAFRPAGAGIVEHPDHPEDAYVTTYQAMLGKGYNSFTSTKRGDCVSLPFVAPASEGYETHAHITVIQSSEDLKRDTSIEVSGSGGFGMVTAEASASFSSSMHFSANSDYLLIRVTAAGPSVGGGAAGLGTEGVKYKANRQAFFTACGNRYISEIQLGGEFTALLEFSSSNETDRKDVQAHLKVASGLNSISTDLKIAVQEAQAKSSMHMTVSRRGTSDPLPEMSIDKLIAYSQEFPSKLSIKTVVPVGVVVSDYQSIDPEISTIEEEPDVGRLRENLQAVNKELAEIEYLTGAYRGLGMAGRSDVLQPIQRALEPKPAAIQQALDACGKAPWSGACKFPAAILDFQVPTLPLRPSRITFTSLSGGENLVGILEPGQEATLMLSGNYFYAIGTNYNRANVADPSSSHVVLIAPNGARSEQSYRPSQTIKGPVAVYVKIVDSYYADNLDIETPAALLY